MASTFPYVAQRCARIAYFAPIFSQNTQWLDYIPVLLYTHGVHNPGNM
jgi:chitinase